MTVAIDTGNVASASFTFGTVNTLSCTCGGADNYLLLLIGCDQATAAGAPTAVSYNSVGATLIGHLSYNNNGRSDISAWGLNNPTTGSSQTISITTANIVTGAACCAVPCSGVDTTRTPTFATASATSAAAAVSAPSGVASDMHFGSCFIRSTSLATTAGTDLIAPINGIHALDGFAADYIAGASAGNFAWSLTSGDWDAIGLTVFGTTPTVVGGGPVPRQIYIMP